MQPGLVRLHDGTDLEGSAVVLAVEGHSLEKLLPHGAAPGEWRRTTCLYYDAPVSPGKGDGYLRLNAAPACLVHNVCFPSDIAPEYAPAGRTLVSVSSLGAHGMAPRVFEARVQQELEEWFGRSVSEWRLLRTYEIPHALPPFATKPRERPAEGIWICGDHTGYPSLNCALATGRVTGERLAESLR